MEELKSIFKTVEQRLIRKYNCKPALNRLLVENIQSALIFAGTDLLKTVQKDALPLVKTAIFYYAWLDKYPKEIFLNKLVNFFELLLIQGLVFDMEEEIISLFSSDYDDYGGCYLDDLVKCLIKEVIDESVYDIQFFCEICNELGYSLSDLIFLLKCRYVLEDFKAKTHKEQGRYVVIWDGIPDRIQAILLLENCKY